MDARRQDVRPSSPIAYRWIVSDFLAVLPPTVIRSVTFSFFARLSLRRPALVSLTFAFEALPGLMRTRPKPICLPFSRTMTVAVPAGAGAAKLTLT